MIKNTLIIISMFAIAIWLFNMFATTPIIYTTYPDKLCVWVNSPDENHSCSNLPKRYATRYVSPEYNSKP